MKLIIVESPTKARTISRFLEPGYGVVSSLGHIRDLPKAEFGVDIEHNFQPKYVIPAKARKNVNALRKEVKKTSLVILATDPDREGEAIAYHLVQTLNLNKDKKYQRIVFHEITKPAIERALKTPGDIDMNLVNAQQARRILDRIVGYKLSPFLWKKISRGLSAGRVQSVAVRLVVEREREIQNFVPQEYWTIEALLEKTKHTQQTSPDSCLNRFKAILVKKNGKTIPKLGIKSKEEAEKDVKNLEKVEYRVEKIEKKEIKKNPPPPFVTSTLQQTAWQKFHWPARMTMRLAQQLYENGKITYHRSDSLNVSDLALKKAREFIVRNHGENYYQFRKYKTKSKTAQEAHEAIRPTYPDNKPEMLSSKLDKNQLKLYDLIWRRFIACQMKPSIFDATTIDIKAGNYTLRATGQILRFEGFLRVYPLKYEENQLPLLEANEPLRLIKLIPSQHFTQPPPRYTEATLIKELEKNGIGRPSTYAPIISIIQERNYVEKNDKKRFQPTEIGKTVNDILVKHFPEIVDIGFTAKMEEELDEIAQGKREWTDMVRGFYQPFEKNLKKKYELVKKNVEKTEKICPKCGSALLLRMGRYGKFYACSQFPKCKYTEPLEKSSLKIKCPKCGKGEIVEKRTKKGKIFYACDQFPKCDFALWDKPCKNSKNEIEKCPKCGSPLVEKGKKIKCSSKNCDFEKNMAK